MQQQPNSRMTQEDEARAIQAISTTLGLKVLVARIKEAQKANSGPLAISGENWPLMRANKDGKAELAGELLVWINGRLSNNDR